MIKYRLRISMRDLGAAWRHLVSIGFRPLWLHKHVKCCTFSHMLRPHGPVWASGWEAVYYCIVFCIVRTACAWKWNTALKNRDCMSDNYCSSHEHFYVCMSACMSTCANYSVILKEINDPERNQCFQIPWDLTRGKHIKSYILGHKRYHNTPMLD